LREELERQLVEPGSIRAQVFSRLGGLLALRAGQAAFHPSGEARVVECQPSIFGLLRISPDAQKRVLCLHNLTAQPQLVDLNLAEHGVSRAMDLISRQSVTGKHLTLRLNPYQVIWMKMDE
jgi:sucrose phosphorylase